MPVHIDDLQSTVELQGAHEAPASATDETTDEVSDRLRLDRYQRDRDRLRADGYDD